MSNDFHEIILGLCFAVMTGAVIVALLRSLSPRRPDATSDKPHLAFYKDQLAEIERDVARGVLAESEAEAARNEVGRRLLAAEDALGASETSRPALRKKVILALLFFVPILTLGLYLMQGSPELRDTPFGPRVEGPIETLPLEALVYRVSQRLKENPEDLKGWEVIAPIYGELERFSDAARAWERAIAIGGASASRLAGLAEARINAADGAIGARERQLLSEAEKLDPLEPRTQYYLGLADIRNGKQEDALNRWRTLLEAAPQMATWREGFEAAIRRLEQPADAVVPDTDKMIEGMVTGLAARLEQQPDDLEGWLRLIRSYGVLGRQEDAGAALARARRVFAADGSALARLEHAESQLKTGSASR